MSKKDRSQLTPAEQEAYARVLEDRRVQLARDLAGRDRIKENREKEPVEWQGPTELVENKATWQGTKKKRGKKAKQVYAWGERRKRPQIAVWASLDDEQKDAALDIAYAWQACQPGSGVQATNLASNGQCRAEIASRMHIRLVLDAGVFRDDPAPKKEQQKLYYDWWSECARAQLNPEACLDYIVHEMGRNEILRKWGRRKAWANENLELCLDVRCYQAATKRDPNIRYAREERAA